MRSMPGSTSALDRGGPRSRGRRTPHPGPARQGGSGDREASTLPYPVPPGATPEGPPGPSVVGPLPVIVSSSPPHAGDVAEEVLHGQAVTGSVDSSRTQEP